MRDEFSLEQIKLQGDVELVREYGQAHPEALVELRYENEPTVRIVALFAGDDLELHQGALRRLVSHPDQLEIREAPWPRARLEEIRAEVHEMATSSEPGLFSGWGTGGGKVSVRLRADGVRVAAQLLERYGDAVDLTVGYFPYPDIGSGRSDDVASNQPSDRPTLPESVSLSLEDGIEISAGSHLGSTLTIRNDSAFELVAGKLIPPLVDPTSGRIVGGYEGAITGELRRYHVAAGASAEVPILIGTASTRPELGWSVPPGLWAIRIFLELGGEGFQRLVPIEVVA